MKVTVCDRNGFKMLRTAVAVAAGETVLDLAPGAEFSNAPTRLTIRVGPQLHLVHPVGRYINHSCEPSCVVKGRRIVALYAMPADAEVTFDYSANEGPLASPFNCHDCGELLTGDPPPCRR